MGSKIAQKDAQGESCLHSAANEGSIDIVRIFISFKVDINMKNSSGETPLILAVVKDDNEMARLLLTNTADPNI